MSDRADFCAFYYAQTGQAAVWIRDEKRFMFSNTELAWQSWQAAQAQAGDGEAPVAWLKPAHELVENSAPDVVTAELRGATIARGGIAASCMENYSVPLYKKQPAVNQQLLEESRFKQGAEGFRKELLTATTPFLWPLIEGVFAVFAHAHGFEPESNAGDQVRKEKAAIAAAQEQ